MGVGHRGSCQRALQAWMRCQSAALRSGGSASAASPLGSRFRNPQARKAPAAPLPMACLPMALW